MQEKVSTSRATRLAIVFLLLLSVVPLAVAHRYPPYLNDDAFITLTYAKNLAAGNGFVFNHPPAVLGTTTPLFAITVAGLALLLPFAMMPAIAVYLSALCWLGIFWVFFFFRKEWQLEYWQVCVLALLIVGSGLIFSLGMEAYPFFFLLVLTISLFLRNRYLLAGLAAGFLFLIRGEGSLIMPVLLVAMGIQHWVAARSLDETLVRRAAKLVVGFAAPLLLWAIYAQWTFGAILPNTLATKQAYIQHGFGSTFLKRLAEEWIPNWGTAFAIESMPVLNFWFILAATGLISVLLRKRVWLVLVSWTALFVIGYSILNVSAASWYQAPLLLTMNVLFALGIIWVVETVVNVIKPRALALGISVLLIAVVTFLLFEPRVNTFDSFQGDSRGESYTMLSQWFREHTDPSDSIAYIEIGYLGYYTDNQIIDLAGLVIPEVVPHVAQGDFTWGFWEYEPDYYVHLANFDWALAEIRADPRFDQLYRPVVTSPGLGDSDITIFARSTP